MVAAWNEQTAAGASGKRTALVELAERLRSSAPEMVVPYTRQALACGGVPDESTWRAQRLLGDALVRLGRYAEAVEPALHALRQLESVGQTDLAAAIRADLAACARALGAPLLGCPILRPVLNATVVRPARRAAAVDQLVGCTVHVGRRDDLEDALTEAGRLLIHDGTLTADARLQERALLSARAAAYHRRYGETEDAAEAAREGLALLDQLSDTSLDVAGTRGRLVLELVCALLDDGQLSEVEEIAEPIIAHPVRAAAAPTTGRLLLAMATRVYLPAGRIDRGRSVLGQVARIAERHSHDWLLADALAAAAYVDERSGRPADALYALRASHAAERRSLHAVGQARRLLMIEFGLGEHSADEVNSLLRGVVNTPDDPELPPLPVPDEPVAGPVAGSDAVPELPDSVVPRDSRPAENLSRTHEPGQQTGRRPVALTLVRLDEPTGSSDEASDTDDDEVPGLEDVDRPAPEPVTPLGRVRELAPRDPAPAVDVSWPAEQVTETTTPDPVTDAGSVFRAARESLRSSDGHISGLDDILTRLLRPPRATGPDQDPQASVPAEPGPSEIPQPPSAPDIVNPPEPDPIPLPPPEPLPAPAPPDPPPAQPEIDPSGGTAGRFDRGLRRRERTDPRNLANLLAEAMVAYQASGASQPPSLERRATPEPPMSSAGTDGSSGRHRLPDWSSYDADGA